MGLNLCDAGDAAHRQDHEMQVVVCARVLALAASLLLGRQPALLAPAVIAPADVPWADVGRPPGRTLLGFAIQTLASRTIRVRDLPSHLACAALAMCAGCEAGEGLPVKTITGKENATYFR